LELGQNQLDIHSVSYLKKNKGNRKKSFLKGHSHEKVFEITPLKVRQPFFNFLIRPSDRYDVLKEGVHNVKWDQLICQKQQLHASKIHSAVRGIHLPSHTNLCTTGIQEAERGVDVLLHADKP
jgi:hypothetical protein